jgi:hypothetical protein
MVSPFKNSSLSGLLAITLTFFSVRIFRLPIFWYKQPAYLTKPQIIDITNKKSATETYFWDIKVSKYLNPQKPFLKRLNKLAPSAS